MTRIGLVEPFGLVADELRQTLGRRKDLWSEIRLLAAGEREIGTLTEVAEAAAMVTSLEDEDLSKLDVAIFLAPWTETQETLEGLPAGPTTVIAAPDAPASAGLPVAAALDPSPVGRGAVLWSPPPAILLLARLLRAAGEVSSASAALVTSASEVGKKGLDELLEQTRSLLSFSGSPRETFPWQRAFNVRAVAERALPLVQGVHAVLGPSAPVLDATVLEAGIFHGLGVALTARFDGEVDVDSVRAALKADPGLEVVDEPPSIVDVAGRSEILVGEIAAVPDDPRAIQLWATMDDLTGGTAANVIRILELLAPEAPVH